MPSFSSPFRLTRTTKEEEEEEEEEEEDQLLLFSFLPSFFLSSLSFFLARHFE